MPKWNIDGQNWMMRCPVCKSSVLCEKEDTLMTLPCKYDHAAPKLMVPALPPKGDPRDKA